MDYTIPIMTEAHVNKKRKRAYGVYNTRGVPMRATKWDRTKPGGIRRGFDTKFYDPSTSFHCAHDASLYHVNTMYQGTASNERDGRKCRMLTLAGKVTYDCGTSGVNSHNRFMIVYDKQPTGALPSQADILTYATPTSPTAPDGFDRFVVLRDIRWSTNGAFGTAIANGSGNFDFYVKLPEECSKVTYETGQVAGTIAKVKTGAIYILTNSLHALADNEGATGTVHMRLKYTDA